MSIKVIYIYIYIYIKSILKLEQKVFSILQCLMISQFSEQTEGHKNANLKNTYTNVSSHLLPILKLQHEKVVVTVVHFIILFKFQTVIFFISLLFICHLHQSKFTYFNMAIYK